MADHIKITPAPGAYVVAAGAEELGRTEHALHLKEGSYPTATYVPRADVDMSRLEPSARRTSCPWKGEASYYSVRTAGGLLENAVWSYEAPLEDMAEIRGMLAFYPDKVSVTRA